MEYADTNPLPRLYISLAIELDSLTALEFGRVDDGVPPESWNEVSDHFSYIHLGDADASPAIGFKVVGYADFDPEDEEHGAIWEGPRFDAPQLGLEDVSAGEVIAAAGSFYGVKRPSFNRTLFNDAAGATGRTALVRWVACLHAGDAMAHFGLGYTLLDLGQTHRAYRHLRYYAGIAPAEPWAHCYLGQAAEALGELDEARAAYRRAIELTEEGGNDTDADMRLAVLEIEDMDEVEEVDDVDEIDIEW